MINVLIVDDHALVRMGLRRLLEGLPDIHVVAEAEDGITALSLVKTHQPHVVLLDMKMPGMDGWEVTRRLSKSFPTIKIIAITSIQGDSSFPHRVMQLGAMGYLTKESPADEIATAIRQVRLGHRYLSAAVAQQMAINQLKTDIDITVHKLTEREMQVTLMITRGMTVSEIADTLCICSKTVNSYRYRIFEKLKLRNDVELTHLAIKHQLVEQSPEWAKDD